MSDTSLFTLTFDQASLSEIAQMYGFKTLLAPAVQKAMGQGAELIAKKAQENTWEVFANPMGDLAATIQVVPQSNYEVIVGSDSPYAARREFGFSGMTDSLGRYYANDPAKPYLGPAMESEKTAVLLLIDAAVAEVWGSQGGL